MLITFVSLFDALKAVALKTSVSDEEVDHYTEAPMEENDFMKNLARLPARSCFQHSRAATSLLQLLFARYPDTKWYDVAGVGLVLQSDKAKEEARQILMDYASAESFFKDQVRSNEKAPSRFASEQPTTYGRSGTLTRPRSMEIRLDRDLLVTLLDKEEVPYSADFLLEPYLGHEKTRKPITKQPSTETRSVRKEVKYGFRGAYADALSYAMSKATDNTDHTTVWAALIELAEGPLALRYNIAHENFEKGIRFINAGRAGGPYIFLTKDDVAAKVEHWVKKQHTASSRKITHNK